MSVVGIDFGNQTMLVGQTSKGGVDVILNESSNRQTATAVSIQGKQRFIGDSAAAMAKSNIKNTISTMKLLVGRQFDDPDVQKELSRCFFKTEKLSNGGVGISFSYNNEPCVVSAEHFMAMMLTKAKEITKNANAGVNIADSVISVPFWFTESQRQGILQACEIADINCLKVANESTLIGLSYGIFKSAKGLFSATDPTYVMFIDMGYTCYSVCICEFKQEYMKVLSTITDKNLGGRDFDDIIIECVAADFESKSKINVRKTPKAVLKMLAAAEKAKKILSPAGVTQAPANVECLAEDRDENYMLTRDELESKAAGLVGRLQAPIEAALQEAGLKKEEVTDVEILGGSSRINIIKKTLSEIMGLDPAALNYGLKTTMNADEAVARGSALQCAILSSRMKVKPFQIIDRLNYGISASYDDDNNNSISMPLYKRGDEIPHKARRLVFKDKREDFTITLAYDDASVEWLPPGETRFLGSYTIEVPKDIQPSEIRVNFNLDKNGKVYCMSAEYLEELPPEVTKETEEKKDEEKSEEKKSEGEEKDEGKKEPKKRFKKIGLTVNTKKHGLSEKDMKDSKELEAQMAYDDRLITETADQRNELESYIYGFRDKIDSSLSKYAQESEKSEMKKKLETSEDWLYNEGFDVSKKEYAEQLNSLKAIGDKIEYRFDEEKKRPQGIELLKKQIEVCKTFTSKYDENFAHITEDERDTVRKETQRIENWMYDQINKQGALSQSDDPVLSFDILKKAKEDLAKATKPIMSKPKPAPVVPPKPEEKKEDKADKKEGSSKDGDNSEKKNGDGTLPDPPTDDSKGEPMEEVSEDQK